MAFIEILRVKDVPPGGIVPVEVGGQALIVYRVGERFFAAQRYCIHQRADLTGGHLERHESEDFLVCPLHGWRYRAETGVHQHSPETCLRTYALKVEGGRIHVDPTPMWQGEVDW